MKKAFKITANNQYVQQVALPADIYTYQCNVLNPTDTYTFGLLTEGGVWNYYEVEVTKEVWAHRAKLEFKTEEAVTAFSLCSANASVANPVYVQNPILAERAEFSGIATKSLEEYVSELENGLVAENCTATLASGVLSISDATADKGKVTLSIIEESSVISTQVFFEKGLTPSQSAKLEAISKGMTVIDGGYIQSNLVELGNPEEALITAGLSGIDKDSTGIVPDGKMPAFWAGGTYEEATSSTAKAIIRHDGTSKFTDTEITGKVNAKNGTIGGLNIYDNAIASYPDMGGIVPPGEHIYISKTGVSIDRSVGISQNQVITSVRITDDGIRVSKSDSDGYKSMEVRIDGIYRNGVKIL